MNHKTKHSKKKVSRKNRLLSLIKLLFKEPRKDKQSNSEYRIRQTGKLIFVSSILLFIIILVFSNYSLTLPLFILFLFLILISFRFWKPELAAKFDQEDADQKSFRKAVRRQEEIWANDPANPASPCYRGRR